MENQRGPVHGHGKDKIRLVFVNTREKEWSEKEINFDQVVTLAYGSISNDPRVIYTVTYKRGHGNKSEGSMVKGDTINVKNEMRFNVSQSNQS